MFCGSKTNLSFTAYACNVEMGYGSKIINCYYSETLRYTNKGARPLFNITVFYRHGFASGFQIIHDIVIKFIASNATNSAVFSNAKSRGGGTFPVYKS